MERKQWSMVLFLHVMSEKLKLVSSIQTLKDLKKRFRSDESVM